LVHLKKKIMADYNEEYDDDYGQGQGSASSLKGYKIVIFLLAFILVAVSGLYFYQSSQLKKDFAIERDTLTNRMMAIRTDLDGLHTENDSLNLTIVLERERTDSVMEALVKERSMSRATIRRYQKELGTMRTVLSTYVHQIDSLNTLNRKLITENVGIRKQITSERLRADMAEERAEDMTIKIRQGSRVLAREIKLLPLSKSDKEVTRVARAARLRVDFVLSANALTNPGNRAVYVRLTGPDGYVLANAEQSTFNFEGDPLIYSAMREVDYQNEDLGVGIYYNGSDIVAGTYKIEVYMDGMVVGSSETILR
jgi:hypothetical protein